VMLTGDRIPHGERKHGVSFDEAKTVYLDPFAETFDDPDHSEASVGSSRSGCRLNSASCLSPTPIAASTGSESSVRVRPRAVKPAKGRPLISR
jgi:hypothetical protein